MEQVHFIGLGCYCGGETYEVNTVYSVLQWWIYKFEYFIPEKQPQQTKNGQMC